MTLSNCTPPLWLRVVAIFAAIGASFQLLWSTVGFGASWTRGTDWVDGNLGYLVAIVLIVIGLIVLAALPLVVAFIMSRSWKNVIAVAVAGAVFGVMFMGVMDTEMWGNDPEGLPDEEGQIKPITEGIFKDHVFALEVLGVLLTAAMIGALVIARPVDSGDDQEAYWNDPQVDAVPAPVPIPAGAAATPASMEEEE